MKNVRYKVINVYSYSTENNECDFQVVRASLTLSALIDKSSIYHCEYYISIKS